MDGLDAHSRFHGPHAAPSHGEESHCPAPTPEEPDVPEDAITPEDAATPEEPDALDDTVTPEDAKDAPPLDVALAEPCDVLLGSTRPDVALVREEDVKAGALEELLAAVLSPGPAWQLPSTHTLPERQSWDVSQRADGRSASHPSNASVRPASKAARAAGAGGGMARRQGMEGPRYLKRMGFLTVSMGPTRAGCGLERGAHRLARQLRSQGCTPLGMVSCAVLTSTTSTAARNAGCWWQWRQAWPGDCLQR